MDQLIIAVARGVVVKRQAHLLDNEKKYISERLKKLDMNSFKGKPISSIVAALVDLMVSELSKLPKHKDEGPIDVHEMLVKAIGNDPETSLLDKKIESNATLDSLLQNPRMIQSIFNPAALHKKAYLILDRKFQASESNNVNEFKWNIANTSRSYDPKTTAATNSSMKDIVKIKMFPFMFPNTDNTLTVFNRLTVEIAELNTQSYIITHINKKFHFSFDIQQTGASAPYNMTDIGNSISEFEFHDPVIELNTITLRFGNPEELINLDPDSLLGTISAVGAQTLITFTQLHLCNVGSSVVISNFSTTAPVDDAVEIDLMNYSHGWEIVASTAFSITIDVDISGLTGAILGNPFYVYLNAKRFALRLELTYITQV